MTLRYRRMKPFDVQACVDLLSQHPSYRPRFATQLSSLAPAIRASLSLDSLRAVVFEEVSADGAIRLMGGGAFVFVTDEFVQAVKTPPFFWIGPEIARLIKDRKSPLLQQDELRRANALEGLNALTWFWGISPDDVGRLDVRKHAMEAFYFEMLGFRLKELLGQGTVIEEVESVICSGGFLLGSDGCPMTAPDRPIAEIVGKPHLFCMNKQMMNQNFGSWTSLLFVYQEPRIGFAPSEQHLLEEALHGGTDEELAGKLQISVSAVKKAWRSVHEKVERKCAGILPSTFSDSAGRNGDRGKGKKHPILAYIREHPEELRPISMKLLRQAQQQSSSDPRAARRGASQKQDRNLPPLPPRPVSRLALKNSQ